MKKWEIYLLLLTFVLSMLYPTIAFATGEAVESPVTLEAERISYDQATNRATASGQVKVRYENLRFFAPNLEMDSLRQHLSVTSSEKEKVTLLYGNKRITGDRLEYDFRTREGIITNARASSPLENGIVYLHGNKVEVVPAENALKKGWVSKKSMQAVSDDEMIGKWENSMVTTCPLTNSHYRLETRKLVFIPGKRVIAKSPEVYIGESRVFKYPFDYVVRLDENTRESSFFPLLKYKSAKGYGLGITGPYVWDEGKIDITLLYWSDIELEGAIEAEQKFDDFTLFAGTVYEYDETTEEKLYRPSWGLKYYRQDWQAQLLWTQREYIETEKKAGSIFKGTLWRDPEVTFSSPWERDKTSENSFWRIFGTWGNYVEDSLSTDRWGGGAEIYGWINGTGIVPFWRGRYSYYDYDRDDLDQNITDAVLGLKWTWGNSDWGTAYVRRWVSGSSPMHWDDFSSDEVEEIYQQVSFNISPVWRLMLRGAYDLEESELDEMVYKITLDNQCCLGWEFAYRDDRGNDNDDWASLKLVIKAFPDDQLKLGDTELYDPFQVPDGIVKK